MMVSKSAYSLLSEKLDEIRNLATRGMLEDNARKCCLEIVNLVSEGHQIMNNEFYVVDDGEPDPAA